MRVNKRIGNDSVDLCMKGNVAYDYLDGYMEIKLGNGTIDVVDGRMSFNQNDGRLIAIDRIYYYIMEDDN